MEEFDFLHHLCIINSNSTEKIIIFSAFFTLNQEKTKGETMKKKVLSMLLAAAMVCSLAACGTKETKKTDSSEDKVLTVAMECGYAPYNWT